MNRRQSMLALGAATLLATTVRAAEPAAASRKPPPFDLLIEPATDCLIKGQNCLSICIYLLGEGQKDMAPVARNVNEMLALCTAVQAVALQHGRQLGGLVPPAIAAAQAAEAECRKHAQRNTQCQECADACAAFIKACQQFQIEFAEFLKSLG